MLPTAAAPDYVITARALAMIATMAGVRERLDSPRTFVIVGRDTQSLVPAGWSVTRMASYPSASALVSALNAGRAPTGIGAVLYDNEGWSMTPRAEQTDPAHYMALAADAAHAHGLLFMSAPAVDLVPILRPGQRGYQAFLDTGILAAAAKVADYVIVQAQGSIPAPQVYAATVRAAVAQARAARPGVLVMAGVSTGPSGQVVTAAQLRSSTSAVRSLVDGYWINIPSRNVYCPKCGVARPDLAIPLLDASTATTG